jgi:hypothetical protein
LVNANADESTFAPECIVNTLDELEKAKTALWNAAQLTWSPDLRWKLLTQYDHVCDILNGLKSR